MKAGIIIPAFYNFYIIKRYWYIYYRKVYIEVITLKIKLICDSLCDIPKEIQDKEYLDIVPLTIIFNDKEYKDGVDISKEKYYEVLKS